MSARIFAKAHQRRALGALLGAALALACALSLVAPATRASSPALEAAVIYPRVTPTITMSHATHQQVDCGVCHVNASGSKRASEALTPPMSACASCHGAKASPPLSACATCHVGYAGQAAPGAVITAPAQWRAVSPAPMRAPKPQARLKFSHAAHPQPCASCHAPDKAGAPTLPTMAQCLSCHDGERADARCETCHLDVSAQPGPVARAGLAPARARLLPEDHTVDWMARHGAVSRAQSDQCASCHTEASCASCHHERAARPFQVHPPSFVIVHAIAARGAQPNCADCHNQQTFCASCHARTGHVSADDPLTAPPPRVGFHPPGWLDRSAVGNHGVMARRDINDCASCHQERDCLQCHQGISPHEPGYTARCAASLRHNPRPCLKCHEDVSALQMWCGGG